MKESQKIHIRTQMIAFIKSMSCHQVLYSPFFHLMDCVYGRMVNWNSKVVIKVIWASGLLNILFSNRLFSLLLSPRLDVKRNMLLSGLMFSPNSRSDVFHNSKVWKQTLILPCSMLVTQQIWSKTAPLSKYMKKVKRIRALQFLQLMMQVIVVFVSPCHIRMVKWGDFITQ